MLQEEKVLRLWVGSHTQALCLWSTLKPMLLGSQPGCAGFGNRETHGPLSPSAHVGAAPAGAGWTWLRLCPAGESSTAGPAPEF